jgi:hypothetical protein
MTLSSDRSVTKRSYSPHAPAQLPRFARLHPATPSSTDRSSARRSRPYRGFRPGPVLGLLQDGGSLFDGKSLLLHGTRSWPLGLIVPRGLTWRWFRVGGSRQIRGRSHSDGYGSIDPPPITFIRCVNSLHTPAAISLWLGQIERHLEQHRRMRACGRTVPA